MSAATGIITTIAGNGFMNGNGTGGYSSDGIAATSAELNFPYAVAFDAAGDMYIPDSANNRIREVIAVSGVLNGSDTITTFAGTGIEGAIVCGPAPVAGNGGGHCRLPRGWPWMQPGMFISQIHRTQPSAR